VVLNYSYVTEMAPGQNVTRVKLVSRTPQNPMPCYARVKMRTPLLPIIAPRLRLLAIWHKQYGDRLASRSAPYIIRLLLHTIPPSLNFSLFLIDP